MTQTPNPFQHHHDHDHGPPVDLDPAQQSFADALRVCFFLLKVVMVVLIVIYLFSGVFNVQQQEKAVRLFLGRIIGPEGRQTLEPGGPYVSAPFPIMQVIRVPTAPRDILIDKAFWYAQAPGPQGAASGTATPLNPEKDGSLITGDANIIHVRWTLTYAIADVIDFLRNTGSDLRPLEEAERLVTAAVEEGIVQAVAQVTADAASKGQVNATLARQLAQSTLDKLNSGIRIHTLSAGDPQFPLSVKDAFDAVTRADTQRGRQVTEAYETRNRILRETAGAAYEPLWELVHAYEVALQSAEQDQVESVGTELSEVLDTLRITDGRTGIQYSIGGEVARLAYDATSYRSNIVQQTQSEVNRFLQLQEQWRTNRHVLAEQYLAETRQQILANARETFWIPQGQTWLDLNRDPGIERQQEIERLTAEEQQRTNQ